MKSGVAVNSRRYFRKKQNVSEIILSDKKRE
jgi:hypothetical protein